ncbi:MAG TPA: GNAT family N-acetyltransferase [Chloroflexia bacterium]|nr:GNAT family N-acetyltransferase [Chloroflexia bacterium]
MDRPLSPSNPMNPLVSSESRVDFPGFTLRDATLEDKAQVLQFTAKTWEFGDYIEYVYDDWLADTTGRFIVLEEEATGRIAAIDKLSFQSPEEAWFEGLRVNPDFRGHGLAGKLQKYMIEQSRAYDAHTLRFITLSSNKPVHRMAYRDGFSLLSIIRFWKWRTDFPGGDPQDAEAYKLRKALPGEAPLLLQWWRRTSAYATAGLAHLNWSFGSSSTDEWVEAAEKGRLLIPQDTRVADAVMPVPTLLLLDGQDDNGKPAWVLSAVTALDDEWALLLLGLCAHAQEQGIVEINGLLPDTIDATLGLRAAGFKGDSDNERLCLFELDLKD